MQSLKPTTDESAADKEIASEELKPSPSTASKVPNTTQSSTSAPSSPPLFSPSLISPSVASALPSDYTVRPLSRGDFHHGTTAVHSRPLSPILFSSAYSAKTFTKSLVTKKASSTSSASLPPLATSRSRNSTAVMTSWRREAIPTTCWLCAMRRERSWARGR